MPSCQILNPRRSEKIREDPRRSEKIREDPRRSESCVRLVLQLRFCHVFTLHMAHHGTSLHLPPVRLFACFSFGTSFLDPCFTLGVPGFGYAACFLWKHEKRRIENHELNGIKCHNQLSQFGILKHWAVSKTTATTFTNGKHTKPSVINIVWNCPRCVPVVPHKAVAEVSKIGHYRRGGLLWCMGGRANPLMDWKIVGFMFFGMLAMVAVVTSLKTAGCSVL